MDKNPIFQRARNVLDSNWSYSLIVLLIGLISYCLQLPRMGFYWDDWQAVFLSQITDKNVLWNYFAYDRPFSAWTFALTFPIFGTHAWMWQLCTLLFRWIGIVCLYQALITIWPERTWLLRWVFALFIVYPGFSLQPVSAAFNQHFLTFAFFGFSIFAMIRAVRSGRFRWLWTILAITTGLIHTFTMEYFIGLELIRPVLLWFLLRQTGEKFIQSIKKVSLWWLPYIAILSGFAVWRFIYYPTHTIANYVRNSPFVLNTFFAKPDTAIMQLVNSIISDGFHLLVNAWGYNFQSGTYLFSKTTILSILIGTVAAVLFIEFQKKRMPATYYELKDRFYLRAGLLGFSIILFGGIPYWLTARLITIGRWSNRLSLAPMLGAILCAVIAVDWVFRTQKQKSVFLAALLCISISAQVRNTDAFRRDWDTQRDYYWQLAWRAPKLQTGTAVIASEYPSHLTSPYAFSFAINTIYGGAGPGPIAQYWFFLPSDIGTNYESITKETELTTSIRNIQYQGNLSRSIAVSYHPSTGCLRVIEDSYFGDPVVLDMDLMNSTFSNLGSQIINPPSPNTTYPAALGKEPEHGWCYYFEKADLARQLSKWDEVVSLMSQAKELSLKPKDGAEYLPLMDAYANTAQWSEVISISEMANQTTIDLEPFLCHQWLRYQTSLRSSASAEIIDKAIQTYRCEVVDK